jgi:SAM-dependent methyltransferase
MSQADYSSRDLEVMSFARNYHAWILARFRPYLGKQVAEVGAGAGSFSELLLQEPIERLVAVEPSPNVYAFLEEKSAHEPRLISHNDIFPTVAKRYREAFDAVVYVNVLEHVEDDAAELRHVRAALKEGGHVCIFVPALSLLYSAHDKAIGHYRRYHKHALEKLVTDAGFELVDARYFDVVGILPWLILVRLLKWSPGGGSVSLYDSVVVPVMRVLESLVPPPVGKNLLLIARKPSRGILGRI